jgi:hypothetical protein
LAAREPTSEVPGLLLAAAALKGPGAGRPAAAITELTVSARRAAYASPGDPLHSRVRVHWQTQLTAFTATNPTVPPVRLALAMAQLHCTAGDFAAAATVLSSLPPSARFAPAIASVVCSLWVAAGKPHAAMTFLDACVESVRPRASLSSSLLHLT